MWQRAAGIRLPYHLNNRKFLLGGGALTDKLDDIATYFFLDKRIAETYKRIRYFEETFNSSNFYTCIQERYCDIRTVAFDIESEVIRHVTAIQEAERHVAILQFKQKHFKRFLSSISSPDRHYLIERYKYSQPLLNDELDRLACDEVQEIEQAVAYRFNKELPLGIELENVDKENHFESMMKLLEV